MKKVITILAALIVSANSFAQWQCTSAPQYASYCLTTNGNNIFAGIGSGGIYLSFDNGLTWVPKNNGLPSSLSVHAIAINDTNIYIGANGGVYKSTNNGDSWIAMNSTLFNGQNYSIAINGNNIFVGTANHGIVLSTDNGINWASTNTGIPYNNITALYADVTNIYAGTTHGVFKSTNNGANWAIDTVGIGDKWISGFAKNGNKVYAESGFGIFYSMNGGSWSKLASQGCLSMVFNANDIIAGYYFNDGVILSNDNGTNWIPQNIGFPTYILNGGVFGFGGIFALAKLNGNLFAATDSGIWTRPLSEINELKIINTISSFQLSPNPTNSTFTISIPKLINTNVSITNLTGKQVATYNLQNTTTKTIDVSNLAEGVYFVTLKSDEGVVTKKMVKTN